MGRTNVYSEAQIELGNRIRELRKDAGLSQMALGEQIGLHFTFVSEVERGTRNVSLSNLIKLARGLHVDVGELVSGLAHIEEIRKAEADLREQEREKHS